MKKLKFIGLALMGALSITAISCSEASIPADDSTNDNNDQGGNNDTPSNPVTVNYTVTFNSNGGSNVTSQTIEQGKKVSVPNDPTREGYTFNGWYIDSNYSTKFDFTNNVVNSNVTIYAKWIENVVDIDSDIVIKSVVSSYESAYITFEKGLFNGFEYYLKKNDEAEYKKIDSDIYYERIDDGIVRVDLMGLEATRYNIKIKPTNSSNYSVRSFDVEAFDRSGYAHFNYTDGVGAYNDNGTLKKNAVVIYVTEENKDTVMNDIVAKYSFIDMFNIPNELSTKNNWNNKAASGIGWWLNNAQYTKATKNTNGSLNEAKTSSTYSATGKSLGFANVCKTHPIVLRFVGTVTTPEGLTAYDSYAEGGSDGDNGHMARMKDYKNITLEGVGSDAIIEGWGFHFMASDTTNEMGKSFEARNLTFTKYPEDALGMEGVQEGTKITASVERCWVHHNTFLPGYCANPAESDKAEGDGSCDFKRGQYFTMSYNYYEYCHKTNLVGSSDSSLQFNISFHHNIWYQCGSRMPLLRQANIHFYNNYIYGDSNDKSASLSYITSLRANSYMYSEGNYYEGAKQVFDSKTGGNAKCYQNVYLQCFSSQSALNNTVSERDTQVSSNCKYQNIDYSNFDTNPNLFYYDSVNKKSNCYLTSAYDARLECILKSGSLYRTELNNTSFNTLNSNSTIKTVEGSINLVDGKYEATIGTNATGITYEGVKAGKFKGQGVVFNVATPVVVSASFTTGDSNAMYAGYIVSKLGLVVLAGSGSATLSPGTYYICASSKDKETTITSLTFEAFNSDEYNAKIINEFNELLKTVPSTINFDDETFNKLNAILDAYNALGDLKSCVDVTSLNNAINTYVSKGVELVVEAINAIGTVDSTSGTKIAKAKELYNRLIKAKKDVIVSNYNTLIFAIDAYKAFAVNAIIADINNINVVDYTSYDYVMSIKANYDELDEEDQTLITNYNKLLDSITLVTKYVEAHKVDILINNANKEAVTIDELKLAIEAYDSLTDEVKNMCSQKLLINSYRAKYINLLIASVTEANENTYSTITLAKNLYDSWKEYLGSENVNTTRLEELVTIMNGSIKTYTKAYNKTESLKAKSGTTADGFTYNCNDFDSGAMKIKQSTNNYLTLSDINSSDIEITINAYIVDSNNEDQLVLVVTYTDGTTETIYLDMAKNKQASTVTYKLSGKTVASVSIVGIKNNNSKNLGVNSFTVVYKK